MAKGEILRPEEMRRRKKKKKKEEDFLSGSDDRKQRAGGGDGAAQFEVSQTEKRTAERGPLLERLAR